MTECAPRSPSHGRSGGTSTPSCGCELAHLCDHPACDPEDDDKWQVEFFAASFVECEDLSHAYVLGPCPKDCPVCFQPAIERVVDRIVAKHERALYDKRRRAALLRQKQTAVHVRKGH